MGMYDHLYCKHKFPDGTPPGFGPGTQFQTKSLDCGMDDFTIQEDGRLSYSPGFGKWAGPDPIDGVKLTGSIEFSAYLPGFPLVQDTNAAGEPFEREPIHTFVALYSHGRLLELVYMGAE